MAKRILTVDDSRTMREMVTFTLRGAGFEVVEAEDGKKAIAVIAGSRPDLIITDLNMPNMDGIELIRQVRGNPGWRATPIIMLTTESDGAKKNEGRAAGATGWLVKPFDPAKLVDVVKKLCA